MKKKILVSALFVALGLGSAWASPRVRVNVVTVQPASFVHNILSTELPAALRTDLKNEYKDYWITDLYEVVEGKQPTYFITVQNADQIVKLSSADSENWVITSTTLKGV